MPPHPRRRRNSQTPVRTNLPQMVSPAVVCCSLANKAHQALQAAQCLVDLEAWQVEQLQAPLALAHLID